MPSTIADFDFLVGRWRVDHRRLTHRLAGCSDWERFTGTCTAWTILGGAGNLDDNLLDLPTGPYRAASMRSFDAATGLWSIWWLDGRHPGRLDTPVVGSFDADIGTFLAEDSLDGRPIKIRFRWIGTGGTHPRWEQAFSGDGGANWESNWTMDFQRTA